MTKRQISDDPNVLRGMLMVSVAVVVALSAALGLKMFTGGRTEIEYVFVINQRAEGRSCRVQLPPAADDAAIAGLTGSLGSALAQAGCQPNAPFEMVTDIQRLLAQRGVFIDAGKAEQAAKAAAAPAPEPTPEPAAPLVSEEVDEE